MWNSYNCPQVIVPLIMLFSLDIKLEVMAFSISVSPCQLILSMFDNVMLVKIVFHVSRCRKKLGDRSTVIARRVYFHSFHDKYLG